MWGFLHPTNAGVRSSSGAPLRSLDVDHNPGRGVDEDRRIHARTAAVAHRLARRAEDRAALVGGRRTAAAEELGVTVGVATAGGAGEVVAGQTTQGLTRQA